MSFERLRRQVETTLVLDDRGGIVRENDPDQSAGPIAFIAANLENSRLWLSSDLDAKMTFAARAAGSVGSGLDREGLESVARSLADVLGCGPVELEDCYALGSGPGRLRVGDLTESGSPEGEGLIADLSDQGMPEHLVRAGFVSVLDLWPPWCAALVDGEIASICLSARLTDKGAAAGVYTFDGHRGSRLAGAVTLGWASHPELAGRELYYSTRTDNLASQRVAAHLGLRHIGMTARLDGGS